MELIWFGIASVIVALYVVLDGFDFGAGALHLFVARTDRERRQVLGAIGPYWDGNEVWLLAGGGVLFLAFPRVLAVGLSGFYFAIMLLLWVLILRGISIEFRSHVGDVMWRGFWDTTLTLASLLAPVLFGAALGNLVRGVPIDEHGWFTLSLFESFSPTGALGILDWFTVLAGVLALAALLHHGALFLIWKTDGDVQKRARAVAGALFPIVVLLWLAATVATWFVTPTLVHGFTTRPLAWICAGMFLAGLGTSFIARRAGRERTAFLGSCAFLLGMLAATAASMYPVMLYAPNESSRSLTALNSASSAHALTVGLYWWPVGAVIAAVYFFVLFRLHRGKVSVTESEGY